MQPRGPNLCPFRSTMSLFWVTALFSEKCTEWPQMTLTCSRSKIPTCMLHTPPGPKFSSVSLYDKPFLSYDPIFRKVHRMTPNDLNMFKVKNTKMHVTYTPRGPNFGPFCSTMSRFWVTHQFPEKFTEWPKWPWHVQGQKYQHSCHIHPQGPNFRPFHSTTSHFWVTAQSSE